MASQTDSSIAVLRDYLRKKANGESPSINREEVVAHAYLSALAHHWPSNVDESVLRLLLAAEDAKKFEQSRWMTQRRLALRKIAMQIEI